MIVQLQGITLTVNVKPKTDQMEKDKNVYSRKQQDKYD